MSRTTARQGVADWVKGLPGVATVYTTFPKAIPGKAWEIENGNGNSAVVVVFIAGETEQRIAIGGEHSGWKRLDYTIDLQIFHRSSSPTAEDAMDSLDDIVDAIKDQLRSDRTMGGVFWQQGEQRLTGEYGEPRLIGSIIETWAQITFTATEMLNT